MLASTAVGHVTILAVVLIVARARLLPRLGDRGSFGRSPAASTRSIGHVGEIVEKSAPVNDIVTAINEQLDAGVDLLEGLLVKKAGMTDAVGLVDGLYAGAAAAGFRNFPESTTIKAPRIGEVYTRGHAHARTARPRGADRARQPGRASALRNVEGGSLAARLLYPEIRQHEPGALPRSPVIGTDAPVQYEQRDDIGAPRKRPPDAANALGRLTVLPLCVSPVRAVS